MILYDKNGLFLGMGNQELSLLGYEDIEEFRNYHNDFADLFVNKPGFIFKFKNFSWIDYTLHSGTPNRRVLVKTKNGREIETSLAVSEIFLPKELNGCSVLFGIELTNAPFKHDLPSSSQSPSASIPEPIQFASPTLETPIEDFSQKISFDSSTENTSLLYDYTPPSISLEDTNAPIKTDEAQNHQAVISDALTDTTAPSDALEFKLKFDHAILDSTPQEETTKNAYEEKVSIPKDYDSIDQIQPNDLHFSLESYPEDAQEDLLNDETLFVNELRTPSTEETPFDLAECAEELGLDISTLAQIIEEYIENLNTSMPHLIQAIQDNNRVNAKEEISKLKSIALHLHIVTLYHHFEHLETSLEFDTKEEILHTLQTLQHSIEAFKESVL